MVADDPDTDRTVALRKARFKVRLRRAAEACGYENLYQGLLQEVPVGDTLAEL